MLARSYIQGTIGTCQYRTTRWLEKSSILERSGTMYTAMVTKISSSYCGAPRVESSLQRIKQFWCKLAEISLFIIFDQNLVSVWHNHLANLHILKSWISLEWREIFENSKQHFPSCADYLPVLKRLRFEKCNFHHSSTFNMWEKYYSLPWLKTESNNFIHKCKKSQSFSKIIQWLSMIIKLTKTWKMTQWLWTHLLVYKNNFLLPEFLKIFSYMATNQNGLNIILSKEKI